RQSHVSDAGVEDLHEGCQRHDHGNEPRIVLGPPNVLVERKCNGTHLRYTSGTTFIPGRSRRSRFSPGSRTIFTGIRWTIFTYFPVAFSRGSRLKSGPVAPAMLST